MHKISIISRGRALGYTLSIPEEDKVLNSLSEMKAQLAVLMGGRVAEEIYIGDVTTGASNDLERASKIARAIVTQYGMSPLGNQVFGQPNHEVFLGRDYGNTQDYSDETARKIDEEVSRLMKEAHDCAFEILNTNKEHMDLMASVLIAKHCLKTSGTIIFHVRKTSLQKEMLKKRKLAKKTNLSILNSLILKSRRSFQLTPILINMGQDSILAILTINTSSLKIVVD